ncbi:MAG: 2-C-methyl-D-erythritol 4-phosphate cytidylyltransferase [Candidatus Omnitrophota bacterium]|jgi:2-C-methyl-D-erythritol 4-phosphate cytidylyltransferase
MSVIALVPSAGSGQRMNNSKDDKLFLELKGRPLLVHVLSGLQGSRLVDRIILIVKESYVGEAGRLVDEYAISKVADIIPGGETRAHSVANGLARVEAGDNDIILVHDGARPFLKEQNIQDVVDSARQYGAAVLGVPCTSTIKKVTEKNIIERTVDRRVLWEAQTPQAFRFGIIKEAYKDFEGLGVTDDSGLVEKLGKKVCIVPGDRNNIKVTVPEDLKLAEAILDAEGPGK